MNVEQQVAPHDDDGFDRLVDGELSPDEYRRLVASLDDRPDGWRRCALAFLEAQALGQELKLVRAEGEHRPRRLSLRRRGRPGSWLSPLLAAAALFLIAFSLGVVLHQWWSAGGAGGPGPAVVENQPAESRPAPGGQLPAPGGPEEPAGDQRRPATGPERARPAEAPLGRVRLVLDGGQGPDGEAIEVPVFDLRHFDPNWLSADAFALPPDAVRALNEMGHRVRRTHRFVPINLEDGRRLVIPVEQVEILPAAGPAFQ